VLAVQLATLASDPRIAVPVLKILLKQRWGGV
jgi:hypothetical protein